MPKLQPRKVVKRKYSACEIAKQYIKRYYRFIVEETDLVVDSEVKVLFIYAVKSVLGLETFESSASIRVYGNRCISSLRGVKGLPKSMLNLSYSEKVSILRACEIYASDTRLLSKAVIENGRLQSEERLQEWRG